ncbi:hypothetical protein M153_20490002029 [Pseudoloma neurophilia]|uniref:Uncharacterized protein n=1 Tax=Pseudoloma neurophilia TaxID=146866 RepID=A0A0R0M2C1_9MICR|nr:hypothetical protein M153_20490002029 [Pseudoloma neurophilia]
MYFCTFFVISEVTAHYLGHGVFSPPTSELEHHSGPKTTDNMVHLPVPNDVHHSVNHEIGHDHGHGHFPTGHEPNVEGSNHLPFDYTDGNYYGGPNGSRGYYYTAPAEEYESGMPYYEETGPEYYTYNYGNGGENFIADANMVSNGGIGAASSYDISYANEQRGNPDAYEAATGQNNIGLETALKNGMNGVIGKAAQAGLEGGLAQGDNGNTMQTTDINDMAMKNMDQIFNYPARSKDASFVKQLALDRSNNTIGSVLGSAALNGAGGVSGAAGLGKIIGNQPGIGPNTGAMMSIATSEGVNGPIVMSPEDLGNEIKESMGATPKVASAAKAGESVGTKAAMDAGITDKKAAETLAGLGEGMAIGNVLDEHAEAMKTMGVEGAVTSVSGYMGMPDASKFGSLTSYLGIGPSGEAAKVGALGRGARGADDAEFALKTNLLKLELDLNRTIQKEKEDVIENTLKLNVIKKDLNDLA